MLTCMSSANRTIIQNVRRSTLNQIQRWPASQICRQERTIHNTSNNAQQANLRIQGLIYKENGDPREKIFGHTWTMPTKDLKEGQVLLKVILGSLNPADINVIQGVYPAKPEKQSVPEVQDQVWIGGNEGFAVVEEVSQKGDSNGLKKGDWVVFGKPQMGVWRSGLICNAHDVIKIQDRQANSITPVMASTLQVNPATAYRMLHDFQQLNSQQDAIIQNAANSAVGQAVAQIASRKLKVPSINLVRDRSDFKNLQELFHSYSNGDENCKAHLFTYEALADRNSGVKEEIKSILGKRKIKLGLNAVCGTPNSNMVKLMSPNSTLVTYGAMSKQPLSIPAGLIIFHNMSVHGFMMNKWYAQNGLQEREELMKTLGELYKEKVLEPPVHELIDLSSEQDADQLTKKGKEAIENTMAGMGGKKIFFQFNKV